MDCEKFEEAMIDELYDELDEVTSAAAKRHTAACARCAALLGGLRATRRVVSLPIVEPPPGLEERILAAARSARVVLPFRQRAARFVSVAGRWAMRPQTAMAALFLLMIGSSVLVIRGRGGARVSSPVTVTDQGSPAAGPATPPARVETATVDRLARAEAVHGPDRPVPAAAPVASAAPDVAGRKDPHGGKDEVALLEGERALATRGGDGKAVPVAPTAAPPGAAGPDDRRTGGIEDKGTADRGGFGGAMALYRAGSYDEALRAFEGIGGGDLNAQLWAARSARAGSGKCAAAARRFDAVASAAGASDLGYQATLEAGQCYRISGAYAAARDRLQRLLSIPGYRDRAQAELQAMEPAPAAKAAVRASPAPAPAAPARDANDNNTR